MNKTHLRFAAGAAVLAGAGFLVHKRAARAEREYPPLGRFMTVDDVRLHYLDEGSGPPLVLLHGLGSMVEDFVLSGLVREASKRYRVIAFDRPGYGHSARPRRWRFGAGRQAELFSKALRALDVHRPIVLGHSWGTLVAASLALEHPEAVGSLVLVSGLYFPSARVDAPLMIPAALPLLGDLMRHTLSPLAGRAMWPAWMKLLFAPAEVPASFADMAWMALRPGQLNAVAEEAFFTLPATLRLARRVRELNLPLVLVAGEGDRYVSPRAHTRRLHRLLPRSRLLMSPHSGHMVHHSDLPVVLDAIDDAAFPSPATSAPGIGTAG
jgi:pimeloyl-ACP methyl ester carboxylesterase